MAWLGAPLTTVHPGVIFFFSGSYRFSSEDKAEHTRNYTSCNYDEFIFSIMAMQYKSYKSSYIFPSTINGF